MLASALIQCHYDYACSFGYSGLTKCSKQKLQITQNKTIRLILGLKSRTHLFVEHFSKANMLPIHMRVDLIKISQMYKIDKGIAPSYLTEIFQRKDHTHNTRSVDHNYKIYHHKNVGSQTFS